MDSLIIPYFYFSIVWTIGITTDTAGRKAFNKYFRQLIAEHIGKNDADVASIQAALFPSDGLVYDYVYDTVRTIAFLDGRCFLANGWFVAILQ